VPFRTSRHDGIGDYARVLAGGLRRHHGIETIFLSGTPAGVHPPPDDGWRTWFVAERRGAALVAALREIGTELPEAPVILHVGGYGYAKRGAPVWLLQGLRQWRADGGSERLLGVFHELYANGKPWQSSFWLGPLQKFVARGIWSLADCGITTNSLYFDKLRKWRQGTGARVNLIPVPSNIGEPTSVPPLEARPRRAMVFGAAGVERAVYGAHAEAFASVLDRIGITEVLDIGSRRIPPPDSLGTARVHLLGRLSADEVSRAMLSCQLGLMSYDTARLGKSTVFASYAAHGVVPVCIGFASPPADGLESGKHVICEPHGIVTLSTPDLERMQQHLLDWYGAHTAKALTDSIVDMLYGVQEFRAQDPVGGGSSGTC
jgi:hypothetical protein